MADDKLILYSYWRSSCSWRVRIALNLKELDYEYRAVHLVADGGKHLKPEYTSLNPMAQVPTMIHGDNPPLTQSMAIIEYLEETYPKATNVLPEDPARRAKVREVCEMINSGTQPLQNLGVLKEVSQDQEERAKWANRWITKGLQAVEAQLKNSSGKYCVGDRVTMADCFLVPQVYNANRFDVNMEQFPAINKVMGNLEPIDAFVRAHPDDQPDCPNKA